MKDSKLVDFFKSLEKPLGMTKESLEDDNEIHKNIVQMDIRADEEGYVYFNELLYKVMKKQYGVRHIRNKKLAEYEANTFTKISRIQEKMSKFLIREDKKATVVNPFLAIMYKNMSFKTWLHYTRKKLEQDAVNDNIAGSEQSNEDFSDIAQDEDEQSNKSEGSFQTFKVETVLSSSANFSNKSKDEEYSESSGIETITEHEMEDVDKDQPDASIENIKGKRLFAEEEEEEDDDEKASELDSSQPDTEEQKVEDIYSDGGRDDDNRGNNRFFEKKLESPGSIKDRSLEKRKSSCPDPNPYGLPSARKKEEDLNVIEENKNEQTFSIDNRDD